nr:hydantoinase B/oxoprolinase family protein [Microbispora sp. H10836]
MHYAIKCLLPDDVPFNEGSMEPVTIHAPEGSAVNPISPAAVGDRHLASQRLASVMTRALAPAAPHRASSEWFVGWPVLICESASPKTGDGVVLLANVAGGAGATAAHDGADAVDVHMANCAIIPAEIIESSYRLRGERYELVPDSGGAGRTRGGLGIRADYRNISDDPMQFLSEAEQSNPGHAPQGLDGGLPGTSASIVLIRQDGEETPLPAKGQHVAAPGEVVSLRAGGGAGYRRRLHGRRGARAGGLRKRQRGRTAAGGGGGAAAQLPRQPPRRQRPHRPYRHHRSGVRRHRESLLRPRAAGDLRRRARARLQHPRHQQRRGPRQRA